MNLRLLVQRLMGRATCVTDATTQVHRTARIFNVYGKSERIRIGGNTVVKGELLTFAHGGEIDIGSWCFIGEGTRIWSGKSISIGHRVMISHNVNIFDNQTHPMSPSARHEHFTRILRDGHPKDIELGDERVLIEDDAWISAGAFVLKGVRVGRAAIVGAGAVVTQDVPDFSVVGGNPARVIRELAPEERR